MTSPRRTSSDAPRLSNRRRLRDLASIPRRPGADLESQISGRFLAVQLRRESWSTAQRSRGRILFFQV